MIDVVCAVIERDGRILACKRRAGGHLAGLWEFPGGKVEQGEAADAALVREISEELAVQVVPGAAMRPVVWNYGRGPIRLLPYRCALAGGEPQPLEHEAIRWCDAADTAALDWAAADVPVLAEWLAGIGH
jgi:8-oxo-dGTP diphosphatase